MSKPFPLEAFSKSSPGHGTPARPLPTHEDVEAARLQAYDEGYKSGWDDAIRQASDEHAQIGEEFARNLRELGFTYHEARAHVIASMEPLVEAFIDALFPAFAADAIKHHITGLMHDHAEAASGQPMLLRVPPADAETLAQIMQSDAPFPLQIVEEPALAAGQVQLVMGKSEYRLDLADVVAATRSALEALHLTNERNLRHG